MREEGNKREENGEKERGKEGGEGGESDGVMSHILNSDVLSPIKCPAARESVQVPEDAVP